MPNGERRETAAKATQKRFSGGTYSGVPRPTRGAAQAGWGTRLGRDQHRAAQQQREWHKTRGKRLLEKRKQEGTNGSTAGWMPYLKSRNVAKGATLLLVPSSKALDLETRGGREPEGTRELGHGRLRENLGRDTPGGVDPVENLKRSSSFAPRAHSVAGDTCAMPIIRSAPGWGTGQPEQLAGLLYPGSG